MRGVCYVLVGKKRELWLAASLYSLRRWWNGPVSVVTNEMSNWRFAGQASPVPVPTTPFAEFPAHILKAELHRHTPYDSTVFLDCDTLIDHPIDELFREDDDPAMLVTPYSLLDKQWYTNGAQGRFRLDLAGGRGLVHASRIESLKFLPVPMVNSGVFAFSKACTIGTQWERAVWTFDDAIFPHHDELALQFLLPHHPHLFFDDTWNSLPNISKRREGVKIWHCSQGTFGNCLKPGLWQGIIKGMLDENFCRVKDWMKPDPLLMTEI